MSPLTFPTPPAVGGWGRLVSQRNDGRAYSDETAGRFAAELTAEAGETAVRLERHRAPVAQTEAPLARTHATLGFLDEGTYALHRDDRFLLVDPLSVAMFAPFAAFAVSHPFGAQHRGLSVFLSDDLFFGGMPAAIHRPWPLVVPASMRTLVLEQVVRRVARRRDGEERLEEACYAVWRSVRRDLAAATPSCRSALRYDTVERHQAAVARTRAYLAGAYRRSVALNDISRAAFVSVFHLTRIFRRSTGLTLHRHLTRLRVRAALIGIADPSRLLDDVGTSVGYVSQSHFTKVVRQTVGRVPRDLRQLILEGDPCDDVFDELAD